MQILFTRALSQLSFVDQNFVEQSFVACNFVDSHSNGPWPEGSFTFDRYDPAAADGVNGAYGSHGILIFRVPGRTGMGIHSGRATTPDGLGRVGPQHCTLGCIRTTDEAMAALIPVCVPGSTLQVE